MLGRARRHAASAAAVLLLIPLWFIGQPPSLSEGERADLASHFRFSRVVLPSVAGVAFQSTREVAPSLRHVAAWISAFGAAVALYDLDGDGLPNEVCHVDARTSSVLVAPAPGTGDRFAPFTLAPAPLAFDADATAPTGCLPGDFNEDGLADALVHYWGRTPVVFLRVGGPGPLGRASFNPVELVPEVQRWYTCAVAFADVDGDGHADLVVGNYHPDGARILDPRATELERMHESFSRAYNGGGPRVLLWKAGATGAAPSVRFEEARDLFDRQVAGGWTLGIAAADLDGDLLPEIYLANDFGPDHLLRNLSTPGRPRFALLEGTRAFTTPSSKVLGRDSFKGMGVDFGDLNGDGKLDIFVSNITVKYAIQESNYAFVNTGALADIATGKAPFVDESEPLGLARSGWAWDAKLADLDNDGAPEIVQATGFLKGTVNRWPEMGEVAMGNDTLLSDPRFWTPFFPGSEISGHTRPAFFVRSRSGRYYDLASDVGLAPQLSRGVAVADVDGDGRLDFALANLWEPSYFYRNEGASAGSFLGLRLLLPPAGETLLATRVLAGHPGAAALGHPAIGAVATVRTSEGRTFVAQVDGGSGHTGKRSPDLHFGLGLVGAHERVRVDFDWRGADGLVRHESLELEPGWHTVVLGTGATR